MYKVYRILNTILTLPVKSPKIGGASCPSVWFHMASLGEINSAKRLIDKFLENGYFVFSTVFTESGYEKLREMYKGRRDFEVVRFPYDKASFIENVYKLKSIRALIIIETELWPNLITIGSEYSKLYLINARISDKNIRRIERLKGLFAELLDRFSIIFPQSTYQFKRFKEFGVPEHRLLYVGNTKIDSLEVDPRKLLARSEIGIPEEEFVVVFGSIRGREIPHIIETVRILMKEGIGIIIAPRHPVRVRLLEDKLSSLNIPFVKRTRSKYKKGHVFIVDTLGELMRFYYLSNVAFVGGTLEDYGGHNVLEPAIFAKPVLFGPFIRNVQDEAEGLVKAQGGIMVKDSSELTGVILDFYRNRRRAALVGENALKFVENLKKSSDKIFRIIQEDLNEKTRTLF